MCDDNFQKQRIEIIKNHLKKETNVKFAESMSLNYKNELISYFCNNNNLKSEDIIAYFEDIGKLASGLFSVIRDKPSLSGIVFFKDGFCFRGGIFGEPEYLDYFEIRYIESKLTKLVIYKNKINSITLKGISYVEPTEIEKLFQNLYKLNQNKITITKKDKLKNFAINAMENMVSAVSEEFQKNVNKNGEYAANILGNEENYNDELVEKAEKFFSEEEDEKINKCFELLDSINMEIENAKINREFEEWTIKEFYLWQ